MEKTCETCVDDRRDHDNHPRKTVYMIIVSEGGVCGVRLDFKVLSLFLF